MTFNAGEHNVWPATTLSDSTLVMNDGIEFELGTIILPFLIEILTYVI